MRYASMIHTYPAWMTRTFRHIVECLGIASESARCIRDEEEALENGGHRKGEQARTGFLERIYCRCGFYVHRHDCLPRRTNGVLKGCYRMKAIRSLACCQTA